MKGTPTVFVGGAWLSFPGVKESALEGEPPGISTRDGYYTLRVNHHSTVKVTQDTHDSSHSEQVRVLHKVSIPSEGTLSFQRLTETNCEPQAGFTWLRLRGVSKILKHQCNGIITIWGITKDFEVGHRLGQRLFWTSSSSTSRSAEWRPRG